MDVNYQGCCPNCGYCPHCGRGRQLAPVYPQPVYPGPIWIAPVYPGYVPQPTSPFLQTTDTITYGLSSGGIG